MISFTGTFIRSTRVVHSARLLHCSPTANMPIQVRLACVCVCVWQTPAALLKLLTKAALLWSSWKTRFTLLVLLSGSFRLTGPVKPSPWQPVDLNHTVYHRPVCFWPAASSTPAPLHFSALRSHLLHFVVLCVCIIIHLKRLYNIASYNKCWVPQQYNYAQI